MSDTSQRIDFLTAKAMETISRIAVLETQYVNLDEKMDTVLVAVTPKPRTTPWYTSNTAKTVGAALAALITAVAAFLIK